MSCLDVIELNLYELEAAEDIALSVVVYLETLCKMNNNVIVITRDFDLESFRILGDILAQFEATLQRYDLSRTVTNSFAIALYSTIALVQGRNSFRFHSYIGRGEFKQEEILVQQAHIEIVNKYRVTSIASSEISFDSMFFTGSDAKVRDNELFSATVKKYRKHSAILFDILVGAGCFSKKELMLSFRTGDLARCELNEFRTLVSPLSRFADEIGRSSIELANYTRTLNEAISTFDDFRVPRSSELSVRDKELVRPCIWLSAYFSSLSKAMLMSQFPQNAFLYTFRSLEAFVDAALFEFGDLEVAEFSGELQFSLDSKKVLGFGRKWFAFTKRVSREFGIDSRTFRSLEDYIFFRNDLSVIHGNARVNASMAREFSYLAETAVAKLEIFIWKKEQMRAGLISMMMPLYNFDLSIPFVNDLWRAFGLKEVPCES